MTFIGHDKVAEALAKGATLAMALDLRVSGNHRMGPGEVEVHEKETDIFYVTEGEATVVTGGTHDQLPDDQGDQTVAAGPARAGRHVQ